MEESPVDKRLRLIREMSVAEIAFKEAREAFADFERTCQHVWGETTPDHIRHDARTIPGDPEGTMGVDWRGPTHVPARTEYRWKRVCRKCGKTEHTTRTKDKVEKIPEF